MLRFKEVSSTQLNCGWCMGAGVVGGVVVVGGAIVLLT